MLIIGDKEVNDKTVAVRKYGEGDQGAFDRDAFIDRVDEEDKSKKR